MKACWQPIFALAVLFAAAAACAWPPGPAAQPAPAVSALVATLEPIHSEVWHQSSTQGEHEVFVSTAANSGDTIRTVAGRALLMWPDLWVELYDDNSHMSVEDATPQGVHLLLTAGTALLGHKTVPTDRVDTVDVGGYAQIKFEGTMVMASYHPGLRIGVVRMFDGTATVRSSIGVRSTVTAEAGQWVLITPERQPRVSDDVQELQNLARRMDLWDVYHAVEVGVRGGFGVDAANRVTPASVAMVFEEQPAARPTHTPTPTPLPPLRVDFRAKPDTIARGDCAWLYWTIKNARSAYISGPNLKQTAAALPTGSLQVCIKQTATYELVVESDGGPHRYTATVTVQQPKPPTPTFTPTPTPTPAMIVEYFAKPDAITAGDCTNLYWRVQNAEDAWVGGRDLEETVAKLPSGSQQVCPTETTAYALVVQAGKDYGQYEVTVYVEPLPVAPYVEFYADPATISAGGCTTLVWRIKNASAAWLSGPDLDQMEVKLPSGTWQLCPYATTSYELVVESPAGTQRFETTVYVETPEPPQSLTIYGAGGPLDDTSVQQPLLSAIPWHEVAGEVFPGKDIAVEASFYGWENAVDVRQFPYDGAKFSTLRAAGMANFDQGIAIWVTSPDRTSMALADWLVQKLGALDIYAKVKEGMCPIGTGSLAQFCIY